MKMSIIYGSDSGNTEEISDRIKKYFKDYDISLHEIKDVNEKIILSYDFIIFGLSTWYVGELQSDWENYFEDFKKINFKNKLVAIFGLGDQWGYEDNFVDGIGIIGEEIIKNNGIVIGDWSTNDYEFEKSLGLKNENTFYGLAIDEDNQHEKTDERIKIWCNQILNNKLFQKLIKK